MKIANGKKIAALVAACSGLFSGVCAANSVNIDILGTVVASACVVNGDTPTLQVNLGDNIEATSLATAGKGTPWHDFAISITSCPTSTSSFSVSFAGTPDTDFYSNTGTASNLKIELRTKGGETLLNNGTTLQNIALTDTHAYELELSTRAVSKGDVMPGTINSQVQATFTYQ